MLVVVLVMLYVPFSPRSGSQGVFVGVLVPSGIVLPWKVLLVSLTDSFGGLAVLVMLVPLSPCLWLIPALSAVVSLVGSPGLLPRHMCVLAGGSVEEFGWLRH